MYFKEWLHDVVMQVLDNHNPYNEPLTICSCGAPWIFWNTSLINLCFNEHTLQIEYCNKFSKVFEFFCWFCQAAEKHKISCFLSLGLQDHCLSNTLLNIQTSRYTVIEVFVCLFLFLLAMTLLWTDIFSCEEWRYHKLEFDWLLFKEQPSSVWSNQPFCQTVIKIWRRTKI